MKSRSKRARLPNRELEEVRERDPDGAIVVHHRTVDTLGKMLRAGTISDEMHSAAMDFRADFVVANIDRLRALPILRVPGSGREPDLSERQVDARRRLDVALDRLGGLASPGGSAIWNVVGMQHSVRHWALRQGWDGRPVRLEAAMGVLVAALGVLVAHYGYGARRAS